MGIAGGDLRQFAADYLPQPIACSVVNPSNPCSIGSNGECVGQPESVQQWLRGLAGIERRYDAVAWFGAERTLYGLESPPSSRVEKVAKSISHHVGAKRDERE